MAYNPYDPYNQGIGALDLGNFGLQQPEENMTVAEAINYGVLPQAQETFEASYPLGYSKSSNFGGNTYTGTTKGDFFDALQKGTFGMKTEDMFNKNINDLFEGVADNEIGTGFTDDATPTFQRTGTGFDYKGNIDIPKQDLDKELIDMLPGGFFKSVGDQTSLDLPANDKYAMAISNYDQLFGPKTMTDAFGTSYNIPGAERPDMYTGLMDAQTGVPVGRVDPGFQNALNAREARMNEIAMQQDPNYGQFFNAPPVNEKKGLTAGDKLGILGLISGSNPIKAIAALANRQKIGRMLGNVQNTVSAGLGSFNKKMRGVNPITGRANTQSEYEQARTERQQQNRTDRMIDRITSGKRTRSNPRDAGTTKAQKDAISAAIQDAARSGNPVGDTNSGGGNPKIVCTMMNERYGFGSFRNKIWMKFHENHGPEYQKGYHTIFLPLVKIAKGEGKLNTAVRKVLEHMGRHVTADMFKIMKGKKRDTLGRIYRAIFEPACRLIGKIKSALGRG